MQLNSTHVLCAYGVHTNPKAKALDPTRWGHGHAWRTRRCSSSSPISGNLVLTTATSAANTGVYVGDAIWLFMMLRQNSPRPRTRFCATGTHSRDSMGRLCGNGGQAHAQPGHSTAQQRNPPLGQEARDAGSFGPHDQAITKANTAACLAARLTGEEQPAAEVTRKLQISGRTSCTFQTNNPHYQSSFTKRPRSAPRQRARAAGALCWPS